MTLPTVIAHCYLVVILAFLENLLTFSDDEQQKIRIFSHTAHFFTEVNEMELDPFQNIPKNMFHHLQLICIPWMQFLLFIFTFLRVSGQRKDLKGWEEN